MLNFIRRKLLGDMSFVLRKAAKFVQSSHEPCTFSLILSPSAADANGVWRAKFSYGPGKIAYETFQFNPYAATINLLKLVEKFEASK